MPCRPLADPNPHRPTLTLIPMERTGRATHGLSPAAAHLPSAMSLAILSAFCLTSLMSPTM